MEKLTIAYNTSECNFCKLRKYDSFRYGPKYKLGNIVAHYYCVLLCSKLVQRGKDDEGMLGFLYQDIKEELKRTLNILCTYCKKGNASIRCASKRCKKDFHLPCGLKNGSLNQFTGTFNSFCHLHYPYQHIPEKILKEASKTEITCFICYEKLKIKKKKEILWGPCCRKSWYHRYCLQKHAYSAGYFFRCPACNDVKKFSKCAQKFGVFIPQQDASWELVPNAFQELLFRYNKCDAEVCLCPRGRQGNGENEMWEVILCGSCGSQGIHVECGGFKYSESDWECSDCQRITKNIKFSSEASECVAEEGSSKSLKFAEICQKKRRRCSEDLENFVLDKRKKCRQDVQEEEIEIDVETVDSGTKNETKRPIEDRKVKCEISSRESMEVLMSVRPGPLSYKLGLIRKVLKMSASRQTVSTEATVNANPTDVIVLSDSEEDDDVKLMEKFEEKTPEKQLKFSSDKVTTDSSDNESKKSRDLVRVPETLEQSSFSLNDVNVLAVVALHCPKDEKTVDKLNRITVNANARKNCNKNLSVHPGTHLESEPPCAQEKTTKRNIEVIEID